MGSGSETLRDLTVIWCGVTLSSIPAEVSDSS